MKNKNKKENMKKNIYKINDLAKALDRDKTTLLRWEKEGLIPKAQRDSRGWRYYSKDEFYKIVNKAKDTNYFNRRVMAMVATLIVAINIFAFFIVTKYASTNSNLNANLNVAAGALSVTASSTVEAFNGITYSFSSQSSSSPNVESIIVSDLRGGAGSWTLNLSCNDGPGECMWRGDDATERFQQHTGIAVTSYYASGSGILCADMTGGWRCVQTAGQACANTTPGTTYSCFPSSKADITLVTGTAANGTYTFAELDWQQGVPAAVSASVYTTTLIYDLQ